MKIFMSWNGYPSFRRNSNIKRFKASPKVVEKKKMIGKLYGWDYHALVILAITWRGTVLRKGKNV